MTAIHTRARVKTAVLLSIVAVVASFFVLTGRVRAQAAIQPPVSDVTTCQATNVNIVRTPYQMRRKEQFAAGTTILTLQGVFADLAPGVTFHVTHVSGQFFGPSNQTFHVRLYKDAQIIEGFNVTDPAFHLDTSTIYVRTLNQPVDLNFAMENDPSQYDMQIVRSGSAGLANGIVQLWGYLTSDTCPTRQ